jgi:aspartate 1-decarboxylase
MLVNVCIAKLHRATVTDADLNYVGSITIGQEMLDAVGLVPGQMVQITNVSNAVLWRTYILSGKPGQIVLNGPPARLFQKGDKVVILGEAWVDAKDAAKMGGPTVAFFTGEGETFAEMNAIKEVKEGWRPE